MCTAAYREALTRDFSSATVPSATASSATPPAPGLTSESSQHPAAEAGGKGMVGQPLRCPLTGPLLAAKQPGRVPAGQGV
jgi:hypothetical protein